MPPDPKSASRKPASIEWIQADWHTTRRSGHYERASRFGKFVVHGVPYEITVTRHGEVPYLVIHRVGRRRSHDLRFALTDVIAWLIGGGDARSH